MTTPTWAGQCRSGKSHRWEPSGWCRWNCGNRDDGRVVTRAGDELVTGPTYSPEELSDHLAAMIRILRIERTPR